jgi:hypothetical protein
VRKPQVEQIGDKVFAVRIKGSVAEPEMEMFRIVFPWGDVEVTRATDGEPEPPDYWVHLRLNRPGTGFFIPGETEAGALQKARIDIVGQHVSDVSVGDLEHPDLYHVAFRAGPDGGRG